MVDQASHAERIEREIAHYAGKVNIHDLPDIFHYWSNKHLAPHVAQVFGEGNMYEVMAAGLIESMAASGYSTIVSVGAGDGSVELALAKRIRALGVAFSIDCLELSPVLIERGRGAACDAGLGDVVRFVECDLNSYKFANRYGAAFAHHSLHHIVELEHLFTEVEQALLPRGLFVVADMIGRNGHMRWPETLAPLERLWSVLPERYKFHHLFNHVTDPFLNWDCSNEGFEGIRAQDIMPCLIDRFAFGKLCVWGGLLDVFVDRGYGHNLSRDNPSDTTFIDRVWAADCALLRARAITPTQMLATLSKKSDRAALFRSSFSLRPEECVRRP